MDEDELQGGEDIMYSDFFEGQGQSWPYVGAEAIIGSVQHPFRCGLLATVQLAGSRAALRVLQLPSASRLPADLGEHHAQQPHWHVR